jgi:hypothetical protein
MANEMPNYQMVINQLMTDVESALDRFGVSSLAIGHSLRIGYWTLVIVYR